MRITTFLGLITSLVLISACNKKVEPIVQASVDIAPALTIAKDSRDQLQKAKDISKELEQLCGETKAGN